MTEDTAVRLAASLAARLDSGVQVSVLDHCLAVRKDGKLLAILPRHVALGDQALEPLRRLL